MTFEDAKDIMRKANAIIEEKRKVVNDMQKVIDNLTNILEVVAPKVNPDMVKVNDSILDARQAACRACDKLKEYLDAYSQIQHSSDAEAWLDQYDCVIAQAVNSLEDFMLLMVQYGYGEFMENVGN